MNVLGNEIIMLPRLTIPVSVLLATAIMSAAPVVVAKPCLHEFLLEALNSKYFTDSEDSIATLEEAVTTSAMSSGFSVKEQGQYEPYAKRLAKTLNKLHGPQQERIFKLK